MRYDEGYGRHGGWEMRMPDGGRGFHRGYPRPGHGADPAQRPWVGGYREGYQGGSGGYALRTIGPLYEEYGANGDRGPDHERGYRRPRGQAGQGPRGRGYFVRARAGYGGDFGISRGRAGGDYDGGMRGGGGYDPAFRGAGRPDFRPRDSPADGPFGPMGGSYAPYGAGDRPRSRSNAW